MEPVKIVWCPGNARVQGNSEFTYVRIYLFWVLWTPFCKVYRADDGDTRGWFRR